MRCRPGRFSRSRPSSGWWGEQGQCSLPSTSAPGSRRLRDLNAAVHEWTLDPPANLPLRGLQMTYIDVEDWKPRRTAAPRARPERPSPQQPRVLVRRPAPLEGTEEDALDLVDDEGRNMRGGKRRPKEDPDAVGAGAQHQWAMPCRRLPLPRPASLPIPAPLLSTGYPGGPRHYDDARGHQPATSGRAKRGIHGQEAAEAGGRGESIRPSCCAPSLHTVAERLLLGCRSGHSQLPRELPPPPVGRRATDTPVPAVRGSPCRSRWWTGRSLSTSSR